jgi:hypothetical protein
LVAALHLLIAAAPFTGKGEVNGFWHYNKTLFIRILTALLYSGVLFAGLAIALQALEHLFGITISSKRYEELYVVIMGVFNTWFFLGGIPDDLDALEQQTEYPKGLKVFTQYILIPLVLIYLLILYAYMGKIVIVWDWPQGWVGKLILCFTTTGILSLLLVHPIKDHIENVWLRSVSKWFYFVLLPLDVMLLLAIFRRMNDYGITESRYIVIVLGLWLSGITLYFVLSRAKNIKIIPSSLCIIAFLSSFGPWGAFHISEQSQIARLKPMLLKNAILVEGKITKDHPRISFEDSKEISSIIRYLGEVHGYSEIQPWFQANLDTLGKGETDSFSYSYRYQGPQLIAGMMGIDYINQWETFQSGFFNFVSTPPGIMELGGYSYLIPIQNFGSSESTRTVVVGNIQIVLRCNHKSLTITAIQSGEVRDSLTLDFLPILNNLIAEYGRQNYNQNISSDKMIVTHSNGTLKGQLSIHNVQCRKENQDIRAEYFTADLLLGYASNK